MKIFSQVPSGIMFVLENCCTCSSFVFKVQRRNSDQLPSSSRFSVYSLSELGDANEVLRNDRLFC